MNVEWEKLAKIRIFAEISYFVKQNIMPLTDDQYQDGVGDDTHQMISDKQ